MLPDNNARFNTRYGQSPVYTCERCGKRTRETGECESSLGLCVLCYEVGAIKNSISDDGLFDLPGYPNFEFKEPGEETAKQLRKRFWYEWVPGAEKIRATLNQ